MGCFDKVAELLFDFFAKLGVVAQEIACVFPALSDADIAVGEPCAGLCDDFVCNAHIENGTFLRNTFTVDNVELGNAERRRNLVFNDFDARAVSDRRIALFQRVILRTSKRMEAKNFSALPPVVVSGLPNITPTFSRS